MNKDEEIEAMKSFGSEGNQIESEHKNDSSRRKFTGAMVNGTIAASANSVFGQRENTRTNSSPMPSQTVRRNSVTQYAKPSFTKQQQSPPGHLPAAILSKEKIFYGRSAN